MVKIKPSDNALGAVNQQERLDIASWIVGFVDGEGCFTISIINNSTTKFGKQIFPEFVITQGAKSLKALKQIKKFFNCGSLILNKRYDNHNDNLYRYCVRSVQDLREIIIPFFCCRQLQTEKRKDFIIFRQAINLMSKKQHLTKKGWKKILVLAGQMNRKKKRF